MLKTLFTSFVLATLALVGGWGVMNALGYRFVDSAKPMAGLTGKDTSATTTFLPSTFRTDNEIAINKEHSESATIQSLLDSHQFNRAVKLLDQRYSRLDNSELDQFKQLFHQKATQLRESGQSQLALQLLYSYAKSYDDIESWNLLSHLAQEIENWDIALIATLRASALENQTDLLLDKLEALVRISRHLRSQLEHQGDNLGILGLAQQLHDQHPGFSRFQLDLARAHLRLGQTAEAQRLLQYLVYDPELGAIASQILDQNTVIEEETEIEPTNRTPDVVVPLIRMGDSLLINIIIDSRPLRLLLDTGASITALSLEAIQRLGLNPTGRYIQLSTANGLRTAQLYSADYVNIGGLMKRKLIVAEIDMSNSSGIQGLLGTDLLNKIDPRYSYIIDNQKNALIFRRR